jgi:hypothetical protein
MSGYLFSSLVYLYLDSRRDAAVCARTPGRLQGFHRLWAAGYRDTPAERARHRRVSFGSRRHRASWSPPTTWASCSASGGAARLAAPPGPCRRAGRRLGLGILLLADHVPGLATESG